MGCDIHMFVETRQPDGSWATADTWYEDEDEPGRKTVYQWGPGLKREAGPIYSGRNYDLFAILANVRNGSGFAGVDTGDGFIPIAMPRGVPEDACPEYKAEVEQWGCDGHSHSYLTLAEVLAYDWTQTTAHRGWVSPVEWSVWRDQGKPNGWSGGVGGGRVSHHTPEDFEAAWQKLRLERGYPEQRYASHHLRDEGDLERFHQLLDAVSPYCQVTWTEPYYKSVHSFWAETIPQLLRFGKPEDVRLVFFFDN